MTRQFTVPIVGLVLVLQASLLSIGQAASAARTVPGPPAAPILRIETGVHTADVNSLGVDAAGRYVVTGSGDRSVRVWDASTGDLVETLRPPSGNGTDGQIWAVAMSPDGKTIACGGETGRWDGKTYSLFLFDRSTGRIVARIGGLPYGVLCLAYSRDGRYLAASLGGSGVRLIRTADERIVGADTDYGDESDGVSFAPDSRSLITSCFDGYLRLYRIGADDSLLLVKKSRVPGGKQPAGVAVSPTSARVAVGFADSSAVDVLSADNLLTLYAPAITDIDYGTTGYAHNLACVAWSVDGEFLYAGGGEFDNSGRNVIRVWADRGHGAHRDLHVAGNTFFDVKPRSSGGIFFATADPAWGAIDAADTRTIFDGPSVADFRNNRSGFCVSRGGDRVSFAYQIDGESPATFSVRSRGLTPGYPANDMAAPVTSAPGIDIEGWNGHDSPTLNGKPLKLDKDELAFSAAISPGGKSFLLGSAWNLRCYRRDGSLKWRVGLPVTAWSVNVSPDGRVAVAAFDDGKIRWFRMDNGAELLVLFPDADRKRWVAWTPTGYYDCSPGAEDLIGWQVNRGPNQAADFFPASRFRDTFYRPDVVARVLTTLDEGKALAEADAAAGRTPVQAASVSSAVTTNEPPIVTILSPQSGDYLDAATVTVHYSLRTPNGKPVTDVVAQVDGRPAAGDHSLSIVSTDGVSRTISVPVPAHDCTLSVLADNERGAGVPASVTLHWDSSDSSDKGTTRVDDQGAAEAQPVFAVKPTLYVLAVGISKYEDPALTLHYSAKDAGDFVAAVERQKGHLYQDVVVYPGPNGLGGALTDADATKGNIEDGLDWIEKETTGHDVAMIFLSGHGDNDPDGKYFFVPVDFDRNHIKKTALPWTDLESTIQDVAGKVIVFDDSCHSGNVLGGATRGLPDDNAAVNELSSAENGAVVFAAATGSEFAEENAAWGTGGNGAFTAALIEGLDGLAAYQQSTNITVNMLDLYIEQRVKDLTGGEQHPTEQKPPTVRDFPVAVKL
ncbi:MAG: caspase family protein [Capsulimonadaceae bacterium]